jgi:hypothetical protein
MEFSFPEFPASPVAQAAFVAAVFCIVIGLLYLAFPQSISRIYGLQAAESRAGAIGEIRSAGGFLAGLAIATLMLDQPILYGVAGAAIAVAAFGRLLALMSDRAYSVINILILMAQLALAIALATKLPEAFADAGPFVTPVDHLAFLVLCAHLAIAAVGLLVMFMPRVCAGVAGLRMAEESGFAPVRAAGGFLLGLGLFGAYINGLSDTMYVGVLFLNMGVSAALVLSIAGRLIAMAINRGNYLYSVIALAFETAGAAVVISSFFGMI